ncbi:unnamed protein product [Urochloa humidicola]
MTDKGQAESNSKDMQGLIAFFTNQFMLLKNHIDARFNALENRLTVIEEQHESRRVEEPIIDMQETSDTDIGNPGMNIKVEGKAQPKKQGTARNRPKRQKKPIQETNVDYEYNIATKRPRPTKNKDKEEVQDGAAKPYQPPYDENTSQGTTPYEFI